MKLYVCKEKPESLMIDVVAAPDAKELRGKYRISRQMEQLNAIFAAWAKKYGYEPKFYTIDEVEKITIDPPLKPRDEVTA
jgi:hypothetical protein